jgi:hypothetical protein
LLRAAAEDLLLGMSAEPGCAAQLLVIILNGTAHIAQVLLEIVRCLCLCACSSRAAAGHVSRAGAAAAACIMSAANPHTIHMILHTINMSFFAVFVLQLKSRC